MRSLGTVIDLVLPSRCAGCAEPGGAWCPRCAASLGPPAAVSRPSLPPTYALAAYAGAPRRAVLAYKERSRRELAAHLARPTAAAVRLIGRHPRAGPLVLVPAPSRPAAARRRGGQHMAAVARRCAGYLRGLGLPAEVSRALRLDARALDSVGLTPSDRAANLARHLHPVPARLPPPSATVILLDDVITTGATAAACVAVLAASGVGVSAVLAITATT